MYELQEWKVVHLNEYNVDNPNHVVITFDGPYKNIYEYAVPILEKFNYPYELFMTYEHLGSDNKFDVGEPVTQFMTLEECKELINRGARLQWHTLTHKNLNTINNPTELENEIVVPEDVKNIDKNGFDWFAYPHGDYNNNVVKEVKKYYDGALSCIQGDDKNRYKLNRITVLEENSFKKNKISVIIPSYNYGHFLIEAIESVLNQTILPDEIIIADDCSTDNTGEISEIYSTKYPDLIKYFRNEKNLGIVDNFNKAVSLSIGEYICILGADNRFQSDYIEKTRIHLDKNSQVSIVYTDFVLFGPNARNYYIDFPKEQQSGIKFDELFYISFPDYKPGKYPELLKNNFIHGSSLFRKECYSKVGGYKESQGPEDHNLFIRILFDDKSSAFHVGEPLLEYRQHSFDQANIKLSFQTQLEFYKKHYKEIIKKNKALKETIKLYKRQDLSSKLGNRLFPKKSLLRKLLNKVLQKIINT